MRTRKKKTPWSGNGGARPGAGRPCLYPGKLPDAFGMVFTRAGLRALTSVRYRLKSCSLNDAVEHLLRHTAKIATIPHDIGDRYSGKALDERKMIMLTPKGARILNRFTCAHLEPGERIARGDVVEYLAREYGSTVPRTPAP